MSTKKIGIGLFSNLQGLEIGARNAGFYTPFSTDVDSDAKKASPFVRDLAEKDIFLVKDVRELTFDEIQRLLEKIIKVGKNDVDLLMGGPPCFGMTLLNSQYRSVFHHLNFLMIEMIRLVGEMRPKVVLMEQVPAILSKQMRPFLNLLINSIERLGDYYWSCKKLNAANFGCFQSRERVIFILVRKDLGKHPSFPEPRPVDLSKQSAFATIGAEMIKSDSFSKASGGRLKLIDGRTNVFATMTSDRVEIFRNGFWQTLTLADRKILAHMEHFDMSSVLEESILVKKLGMMVIPPFAEALCKHILDEILTGASI